MDFCPALLLGMGIQAMSTTLPCLVMPTVEACTVEHSSKARVYIVAPQQASILEPEAPPPCPALRCPLWRPAQEEHFNHSIAALHLPSTKDRCVQGDHTPLSPKPEEERLLW